MNKPFGRFAKMRSMPVWDLILVLQQVRLASTYSTKDSMNKREMKHKMEKNLK